eukprot:COSAG05_NODE_51_length_23916_cov_18.924931_9_plen_213_part_00
MARGGDAIDLPAAEGRPVRGTCCDGGGENQRHHSGVHVPHGTVPLLSRRSRWRALRPRCGWLAVGLAAMPDRTLTFLALRRIDSQSEAGNGIATSQNRLLTRMHELISLIFCRTSPRQNRFPAGIATAKKLQHAIPSRRPRKGTSDWESHAVAIPARSDPSPGITRACTQKDTSDTIQAETRRASLRSRELSDGSDGIPRANLGSSPIVGRR